MRIHQPAEFIEDANEALQMLKDGNERFLKGELIQKIYKDSDRELYSCGQNPFAVILTCSDSRVAPEIFFDQKLGDIFIIRNAGNIVDETALGSIEYAIEHLKCKLVVICGHSKCGAIEAACSKTEFSPNIRHLLDHIKPALKNGCDLDEASHKNVEVQMEQIKLDGIVMHSGVMVAGAYYDIHSGIVTWLE